MRAVWLLAAACSLAAAEDPRELVRHAVQLMDQNLAIARNYTFLERTEIRELDSNSRVTSRKVKLYDVIWRARPTCGWWARTTIRCPRPKSARNRRSFRTTSLQDAGAPAGDPVCHSGARSRSR